MWQTKTLRNWNNTKFTKKQNQGRNRQYGRRIPEPQIHNHWAIVKIPRNVRRTPRNDESHDSSHGTHVGRKNVFSTKITTRTDKTWTRGKGDQTNAQGRGYQTIYIRKGCASRFWTKEMCNVTILYRLPKRKRDDHTRLVSDSQNRKMHRPPSETHLYFPHWTETRILKNQDRGKICT